VVLAMLAVVGAGCGVGSQDEPEVIGRRDVPFELLDTTTTTTDPRSGPGGRAAQLYFAVGDRLLAVTRPDGPSSVGEVLELLLEGPTTEEATVGLTTAIPSGARIREVVRDGETITIDLATAPGTPERSATLAVAQLVLTATSVPGIAEVRFRVDGEPVQVPNSEGTLTKGPVDRSDYESLVGSGSGL
jgi:spore germination protein GerM